MERHASFTELVKLTIKYLSPGGNNIFNSLASLSNFLTTENDLDINESSGRHKLLADTMIFNKVLGTAFASYYNCPAFLFYNYSTLVNNLRYGQVDAGSVANVKHIIKQYNSDIDTSLSIKEQIVNKIPEMPSDPELAKKMVSYFFRKYNQANSILDDIPNYDFKKLTLAILYGFDNFQTIDSKYFALKNLPEQLVMPVIDQPLNEWGVSGNSNNEILVKLSGFDLSMHSNNPLYKIFTNYLAKNPEVGKTFRYGNTAYSIQFNKLLYLMNLLPSDRVDEYLNKNTHSRSSDVFSSLGLYLSDEGILPDYNDVCQDILDKTELRTWKNINFYLLYKTNKEKALKLIDYYKRHQRVYNLENINFTLIDPDKFMDFALSNLNIVEYNFSSDELCLAYLELGQDIFKFPPAILDAVCKNLAKNFSFDDPDKYNKFLQILESNPNFSSLSSEEQDNALSFYRLSDLYTYIPYEKIINFSKFTGIEDRTTAANHFLLFGEYNPEWVSKTPRNIGSIKDIEKVRYVGQSVVKDGFLLAPLENILSVYNHQLFSDKDRTRPVSEIALVSDSGLKQSDIETRFITIDGVKESIAKSALRSPAYAELEPGSRDYYYLVYYLSKDYSLRGQNPKLFFLMRDLITKSKIYNYIGLSNKQDVNDIAFTVMANMNYEPTTLNFQKVREFVGNVTQFGYRYPWSKKDITFIVLTALRNNNNNIEEAENNEDIRGLYEKIFVEKVLESEDIEFVNSLKLKLSEEHIKRYDSTLGIESTLSDANTKITKAVSIFGNLLPQALDQFSRVYCKSEYGLNVRNVDSLSPEHLENVIYRFIENLPRIEQNYTGYAQYFQSRFTNTNDLGILRKIGDNWNAEIKIFDDQNKLVGTDIVKNIAKKYTMSELNEIIKLTTASEILEDFENCNRKFLLAFSSYDSTLGDDFRNPNINSVRANYPIREKAYLDGLNVPLPSWANYRNSIVKPGTNQKITLRFLPRDDARGMYLGVIASCCQHPDGQAGTCAIDGHVNPKAAFMVFEIDKQMIAEAYTWEDNSGNICLDSIETIGNTAFHSEKTKEVIKQLLVEFGQAQENCMVNVGNNSLDFNRSSITMTNPTQYYKDYVSTLDYQEFYRDDHDNQYTISDTRNVPYDQNTYDQDNPPQYSGDMCPLCNEPSLIDGLCRRCDYSEEDYSRCPDCSKITLDENGICQATDCSFRYGTCPICEEQEYNEETGRCSNCRYDYSRCTECPKCGEDSLLDGDCINTGCYYDSSDYIECPNCGEDTYDEDDNECFKCGHVKDEDEEDDEEEEIELFDEED
jgi:hypothetical protein